MTILDETAGQHTTSYDNSMSYFTPCATSMCYLTPTPGSSGARQAHGAGCVRVRGICALDFEKRAFSHQTLGGANSHDARPGCAFG